MCLSFIAALKITNYKTLGVILIRLRDKSCYKDIYTPPPQKKNLAYKIVADNLFSLKCKMN